jgi:hypothetical protein
VTQLRGLMKKTCEMGCMEVFLIGADGKPCLETPNFQWQATQGFSPEQVFLQKLNRHLETIRATHNLWQAPTSAEGVPASK